jgi:hypothetical protein
MTAQSAGTVLNAAGAVSAAKERGRFCRAFRAAAKKFCNGPKGRRFNDYFFKELKDTKKYGNIAKDITREAPILMSAGQVAAGGVTPAMSAEAIRLLKLVAGAAAPMTGATNLPYDAADAARGSMLGSFYGNAGRESGCYMRFLDGKLPDGTVIEIKGPGDEFRGSQAKDLQTIDPNKSPVILSCESCKAKCTSGGGKAKGCKGLKD